MEYLQSKLSMLSQLGSSDLGTRRLAVRKLATAVEEVAAGSNTETFSKFMEHVTSQFGGMVKSKTSTQFAGFIAAMDVLISDENDDLSPHVHRWLPYLRTVIQHPRCDEPTLAAAVHTVGRVCSLRRDEVTDFVQNMFDFAVEALAQDRAPAHALRAATLLLAELASNASVFVGTRLETFKDAMWRATVCSDAQIRVISVHAVHGFLSLAAGRPQQRKQWHRELCQRTMEALLARPKEYRTIHGGLLCARQLALHGVPELVNRFPEVCEAMIRHLEHKELCVRAAAMELAGQLAELQPEQFGAQFLSSAAAATLPLCKQREDRPVALSTLGRLAHGSGSAAIPDALFVQMMSVAHGGLSEYKRALHKAVPASVPEALRAISMIAQTMGSRVSAERAEQLAASMIATGLSVELTQALVHLAQACESSAAKIEAALAAEISGRLEAATDTPAAALQAIASFEWQAGLGLARLAEQHLGSTDELTRTHAALAVLRSIEGPSRKRGTQMEVFATMVEHVLVVAVSDPAPNLRATLLQSLGSRACFLSILKRPHLVRLLATVLNDGALEVRRAVVPLLGQLAPLNPSVVMGSLQKSVKRLVSDLSPERSTPRQAVENTTLLLGELVRSLKELICPYKEPIVSKLLKILQTKPSGRLAEHAMRTLGEVVQVVGEALTTQVDQLVSVVVDQMATVTRTETRVACLEALAQIVSGTGCVVTPYEQHPELHHMLLDSLQPQQPWAVRRAAAQALGIIGALDPQHRALAASREAAEELQSDAALQPKAGQNDDKLTMEVVEKAVCLVLSDSSFASHHNLALKTAVTILKCVGSAAAQYLARLVPLLSKLFKEHSHEASSTLLLRQLCGNLAEITTVVGPLMRPYLRTVFGLVHSLFPAGLFEVDDDLLHVLAMICHKLALSCSTFPEFQELLPEVLPQLVRMLALVGNRSSSSTSRAAEVETACVFELLCTFAACGAFLNSWAHIVLPSLIHLAGQSSVSPATRAALLCALASYAANPHLTSMQEHLSQLVSLGMRLISEQAHTLLARPSSTPKSSPVLGLLSSSPSLEAASDESQDDQHKLFHTACLLLRTLSTSMPTLFAPFVPVLKQSLASALLANTLPAAQRATQAEVAQSIAELLSPLEGAQMQQLSSTSTLLRKPLSVDDPMTLNRQASFLELSQINECNVGRIAAVWDTAELETAADWQEWLRRLTNMMMQSSPSPMLRSCAHLVSSAHLPCMEAELFHAGFAACWGAMESSRQQELASHFKAALQHSSVPVLQALISLEEAMTKRGLALSQHLPRNLLAGSAETCQAYAKALRYREQHFESHPSNEAVEALIQVHGKLDGHSEAALGVLKHAGTKLHLSLREFEYWHEELQQWDEALAGYRKRLEVNPHERQAMMGQVRCLKALSNWEELLALSEQYHASVDKFEPAEEAELAELSSWSACILGDWQLLERHTALVPQESMQGQFFRSVLLAQAQDATAARVSIEKMRSWLDADLTSQVGESYDRVYLHVVTTQQLAELEEVLVYGENPRARDRIGRMWRERLKGCSNTVQLWEQLLAVRKVAIHPSKDPNSWSEFAALCRKQGRLAQARRVLSMVMGHEGSPKAPYMVRYCHAKTLRIDQGHAPAEAEMRSMIQDIGEELGASPVASAQSALSHWLSKVHVCMGRWAHQTAKQSPEWPHGCDPTDIQHALESFEAAIFACPTNYKAWYSVASLHYTLASSPSSGCGSCVIVSNESSPSESASEEEWADWLQSIEHNSWVQHLLSSMPPAQEAKSPGARAKQFKKYTKSHIAHVVLAIRGFFKSIQLLGSRRESTDLILRLLTLWFRHGSSSQATHALADGFNSVPVDTWLSVMPQIIARAHTRSETVRDQICELLSRIGAQHPQAVVWPLSVASKTQTGKVMDAVMHSLQAHSGELVQQASMVAHELVRVAILWEEQWTARIHEAHAHYLKGDEAAMMAPLAAMHRVMRGSGVHFSNLPSPEASDDAWHAWMKDSLPPYDNLFLGRWNLEIESEAAEALQVARGLHSCEPSERAAWGLTNHEKRFIQRWGAALTDAHRRCERYVNKGVKETSAGTPAGGRSKELHAAWQSYIRVCQAIEAEMPKVKEHSLPNISSRLARASHLQLAMPGTYKAHQPIVSVESCGEMVRVILSKQRPRRMMIRGSDGKEHTFLLKGNEDLRQDERVMQLLGLANSLLAQSSITAHMAIEVARYSVIPLSPNCGLVEWVPNCDTLEAVIIQHRRWAGVSPQRELKLMNEVVRGDYDAGTKQIKLKALKHALAECEGNDLERLLWLRAPTTEEWLKQRWRFTRSMAVMSMLGYVLGLGDRHPSNLLIHRSTGKLVHIDFGDCFEVAMKRDRFPEGVPFRLTRMLVNAMGASKLEGPFRITCESVMRVLRDNQDPISAMMEAFVYDPLIAWRLLNTKTRPPDAQDTQDPAPEEHDTSTGAEGDERDFISSSLYPEVQSMNQSLGSSLNSHNSVEEELRSTAQQDAIDRVRSKLTGKDFQPFNEVLDVPHQVNRLIEEATSHENLSKLFKGWCAFW